MSKDKTNTFSFLDKPVRIAEQIWPAEVQPFVSISCTTYNHEKYIKDAFEGFLIQETTFPVEILVHDDASTDDTADIIRKYEAEYPFLFKVIYQKENQYSKKVKIGSTFQNPRALGKYYAPCEGDDYWTDPLKLQKQVDFLEEHPDFSLACGGYIKKYLDSEEEVIINNPKAFPKTNEVGFEFGITDLHKKWLTKTLTVLFRKASFQMEELDKYRYTRDVHLFYHIMKNGKGVYFQEVFGVYNIHEGGVHSMDRGKKHINTAYMYFKELYLLNKDLYTTKRFFDCTLQKLHFDLRNPYSGNNWRSKIKLFLEAVDLAGDFTDLKRIMKIFLFKQK